MNKKKYFYTYEEYSQDTRSFEIESDKELSKKEITNFACSVDLVDDATYEEDGVVVKFTGTEIVLNNANANYDTKVMADNGQVVLHVDASHNRVGINTTSPSVDLDIDGTTKSTQYVTTVGTQDLGNGDNNLKSHQ